MIKIKYNINQLLQADPAKYISQKQREYAEQNGHFKDRKLVQKQLEKHYQEVLITGRGSNVVIELGKPIIIAYQNNKLKQALINNLILWLKQWAGYPIQTKKQWGFSMGLDLALPLNEIRDRSYEYDDYDLLENRKNTLTDRDYQIIAYGVSNRQSNTVESVLHTVAKELDGEIVNYREFLIKLSDEDHEVQYGRCMSRYEYESNVELTVWDRLAFDYDQKVAELKEQMNIKRLGSLLRTKQYKQMVKQLGDQYGYDVQAVFSTKAISGINRGKLWQVAKGVKKTDREHIETLFKADFEDWLKSYQSKNNEKIKLTSELQELIDLGIMTQKEVDLQIYNYWIDQYQLDPSVFYLTKKDRQELYSNDPAKEYEK